MRKDRSKMTTAELLEEAEGVLRKARKGVRAASRVVESMETIFAQARRLDYLMGKEPHIIPLQ